MPSSEQHHEPVHELSPAAHVVSGGICLQGGAEFGSACEAMDREVLGAVDGSVVVLPVAAALGREYATAGRNGADWYARLGAADVRVAPDPRTDATAARSAVEAAALVVLPGGAPGRLLDVLESSGLDEVLLRHHHAGGVISGASAGAMALATWCALPGAGDVRPGLMLVPGLVLPHHPSGHGWLARVRGSVPPSTVLLGLPECAGLWITDDEVRAVGDAPSVLIAADGSEQELPVGSTVRRALLAPPRADT